MTSFRKLASLTLSCLNQRLIAFLSVVSDSKKNLWQRWDCCTSKMGLGVVKSLSALYLFFHQLLLHFFKLAVLQCTPHCAFMPWSSSRLDSSHLHNRSQESWANRAWVDVTRTLPHLLPLVAYCISAVTFFLFFFFFIFWNLFPFLSFLKNMMASFWNEKVCWNIFKNPFLSRL